MKNKYLEVNSALTKIYQVTHDPVERDLIRRAMQNIIKAEQRNFELQDKNNII